ncbi:hypothetical protein ACSLNR_27990, partial [Escherichia coli]
MAKLGENTPHIIDATVDFMASSQAFQRLEESVANMKANADALNRDIATIHSNIVQEYNTLKGYSWK